jgi:hypothetical protein
VKLKNVKNNNNNDDDDDKNKGQKYKHDQLRRWVVLFGYMYVYSRRRSDLVLVFMADSTLKLVYRPY